jgi:hypothetical protein
MHFVQSRLTGKPHALCEVCSQLAKMMQEIEILSKKDAYGLKIHRGFIARC